MVRSLPRQVVDCSNLKPWVQGKGVKKDGEAVIARLL